MKGHPEVIQALNDRLSEELAAVLQYMVHAEMAENWGYTRLAQALKAHAITEMRHAERHIERILSVFPSGSNFLEGFPEVSRIAPIHIGKSVEEIILNDYEGEVQAVRGYNETMNLAQSLGDNGTRDLIGEILKDEEGHVDWLEEQRDLLGQMGLPTYLLTLR
ncbi:bacterioferritin [Thermus filiformis]|uniref:Bacterioferritin n=1 Tax=Thermus filiformis TaxID=276 RepID=A0A0A2WQP0_THEFI|nr:bacterioferritin [Thermus filiformis]KGQ22491.1 bacterioferritin [Thermus filiformis]